MTRPSIIGLADFKAIRRQRLTTQGMASVVANIEAAFRLALGIADLPDDDVVWALYNPEGQTPAERAGVRVVRMCIAFRDAAEDGRDGCLDMLEIALADADPLRVKGAMHLAAAERGGLKSGTKRSPVKRHPRLVRAIEMALARGEDPREYRDEWCGDGGVGRTAFYELIKRIEEERQK